jgi:hypothetical protein
MSVFSTALSCCYLLLNHLNEKRRLGFLILCGAFKFWNGWHFGFFETAQCFQIYLVELVETLTTDDRDEFAAHWIDIDFNYKVAVISKSYTDQIANVKSFRKLES